MRRLRQMAIGALLVVSQSGPAFENAQVLPAGVRRVAVQTVHTQFDTKSDGAKQSTPLAAPLNKQITYDDFLKARAGMARTQLAAFLKSKRIDAAGVVGQITADVKGQLDVYAPNFAYGINNRWTVGVAVPFYFGQTDTDVAFRPNQNADSFVASLTAPDVGQRAKAQEAVEAINGVVDRLNDTLTANGYQELGAWDDSGLGDVLVKSKYQVRATRHHRLAGLSGIVAPTGSTDDPDILTDVAFGDGTWDAFGGFASDWLVSGTQFVNVFATYTHQFAARRTVRMKTADEPLAVPKKEVAYKLGDKIDAGTSYQYEGYQGLTAGLGYLYYAKFKDDYDAGASSEEYEKDTAEETHSAESSLGYSSIPAFRRKTASVPYTTALTYKRLLQSRNRPIAHLVEFNLKLFF